MRRFVLLLLSFFLCRPIDSFRGLRNGAGKFKPRPITATAIQEEVEAVCTFRSPETKVFIEDTDAYGIMYNGNYLRSYDRAIHLCTSSLINNNDNNDNDESRIGRVTSQNESWSIVSMGNQKFVSSPFLGGDFVVEGILKDSTKDLEVWDLKMTSPDGETVFNSVEDLKIARTSESERFALPYNIEPFLFENDEAVARGKTATFPVYRDEIDAHWKGRLPLRNVLNFFERARSNLLGGPDDLKRLQVEDDILVVVTSIGDCHLIDDTEDEENHETRIYPGQKLCVETLYAVRRRGMVLECYQTLKDENGSRLAQGKVTLMFIKNSTRRPTSKLPEWVKQGLGIV